MPDGTASGAGPPLIVADQPVLVFGGCYSNLQATEALLAAAARHGISPTRMVCTGDVVAYGADPQASVDLLREQNIATVMGNCEEQLAADAGDCGCGFAPGSACDRLSSAWFSYASTRIDGDARAWMAALPRRIDLAIGGRRFAIVHGAPSRINRFLFASDAAAEFALEIDGAGTDGVIAGHCGIGFSRALGGRLWHNAGAIGLPANDGLPCGWYSILAPEAEGIRIARHRLDYDHRKAATAMRRAKLPEDYAEAIETGIWPSFDILPIAEQAATGSPQTPDDFLWPEESPPSPPPSSARARVGLEALETLWFNTGTLCNIACAGCYIESSPRNDRLVYLGRAEFLRILDEAATSHPELREIGFTGGEPFMNRDALWMIETALARGYRVLVLTNAMLPMQRHRDRLRNLRDAHGARLALRVSLDHFTSEGHERIRGAGSWAPTLAGMRWLAGQGFAPSVAARFDPQTEDETAIRGGFAALFADEALPLDAHDPLALVLFPEMSVASEVTFVGEAAWRAMRRRGRDAMCRTSRMVVHRKGAAKASILACTLLPHDPRFNFGETLTEAAKPVTLDHPHCAQFCVFGAASCTAAR